MPTPQDHLSTIAGGMAQKVSDGVAWAAVGAAASAPLWKDRLREISELAALAGPILAAVVVALKGILYIVQIWKEIRSKGPSPPT